MSNALHIQKNDHYVTIYNEDFIEKANHLKPELYTTIVKPISIVKVRKNSEVIHGWEVETEAPISALNERKYRKDESFILDFGDHYVGYISMNIRPVGSPPDAPLRLKLTIGEMPVEMAEPFEEYDGWLSSSWLQEETIYVDVLPGKIDLPRRYCFRYIKFEILDTSPKYQVIFENVECKAVTSANIAGVKPLQHTDEMLKRIDKVSIKTLADCMQDVFEDGPKRDRRLWLGDLRLQALADYETFKTKDLVKRCLYLFAGVPDDRGQVTANVFTAPSLIADDTVLYDYSLFFAATLHDYYFATKDITTLKELWPTAYRQIELALARLDNRCIVKDSSDWWSFIDWKDGLNKQTPSQAILIYTMKQAIRLAEVLARPEKDWLEIQLTNTIEGAIKYLWDEQQKFFISGDNRQVSWASQIWMVLADILPFEENKELMNRLLEDKPECGLATPYMYHHLVEALILVDEKEKAISMMKLYWGGMIEDGADTFWELYDPGNKNFSPYGSDLINSYCHAWSCTPTYLIRKYKL
ncbi:alpha-L-rhamnosidase-related protein [Lederbergia lenta]|uniref:Bacterial alpha-L-rhamnosidase n=1 Tax=Lederbergia lenta TaxID=1467 RepID=A0A2X4Z8K8_LEDLE|nr:family 78 glycoside hydrolase catalytic domain [Lederbergia lenta]MCM3110372.1 family 78 glycoside hydrolase catalytic domain [Lederbergia lenta]MEC2324062.1 family 78 glycoside hydrolase catalytic domain [Lederbergia lenta]SQI60715.1 Bacterial alpha-L-rhamnosidase [Lederbergia lenta]